MTIIGGLLVLWGALVLGVAPVLHRNWKGMLRDMRRDGVRNTLPLTSFFASEAGLRKMRIAGGVVAVVGVAMVVIGLVRG